MLDWIKQPWVWGAFSAIVAALGFAFTHFVGKHRFRYWWLQRFLDKERTFYRAQPAPTQAAMSDPAATIPQKYVFSIEQSLTGFEQFPAETAVREAKEQLRGLLTNLRITHNTLVSVLKTFSLENGKHYFEKLDDYQADFLTHYFGGKIPHDAHTHCEEIVRVIANLNKRTPPTTPGWQDISALQYSVVVNDRDVIVPMMKEVLERTHSNLSIIAEVAKVGDFRKAVIIKEHFWFEIQGFYYQLNSSLEKMDALISRFK
jgi:hypothetical protein